MGEPASSKSGSSTAAIDSVSADESGSSSSGMTSWVQKVNSSWKKSDDWEDEGDPPASAGGRNPNEGEARTSMSLGVDSHFNGTCQPCVFHISHLNCSGAACRYCHLSHPEVRRKPGLRKNPREKIEQRIRGHFGACRDLTELHEKLQAEAARNPYAKQFIKICLDEMRAESSST